MTDPVKEIQVIGANEHNLKNVNLKIKRNSITIITGVSGSGKSSMAFDTILAESQRRFFYTLSQYSRQFLDLGSRPAVRHVSGLSPAISLEQNETQPSKRASVGTLTDLSELFGVVFANHSTKKCPTHGLATTTRSVKHIIHDVLLEFNNDTMAICSPLVEQKKGAFHKKLTACADKGYVRIFIDGKIVPLSPIPELNKLEKHTIKLIIDLVKVKSGSEQRLRRGIETALEESDGYGELYSADSSGIDLTSLSVFSTRGGCPTCGYSWPRLDPRYFSSNSIGKCLLCNGIGLIESDKSEENLFREVCLGCSGTGLSEKYIGVELFGYSHQVMYQFSIDELFKIVVNAREGDLKENPAFMRVSEEIIQKLDQLIKVGLGYLQMSRRINSLSAGESQRLRLASILSDSLRGVMYILDEPSQGLHPRELEDVWRTLELLKEKGNTVIIVDHDEFFMKNADWIIDFGPGGGAHGGNITAVFKPEDAKDYVRVSKTAKHLFSKEKSRSSIVIDKTPEYIVIKNATLNNLKIKSAKFMLGGLNVVTGVSGAGKSSLLLSTLYPNIKEYLRISVEKIRSERKLLRETGSQEKITTKKELAFDWRYCDQIQGIELVSTIGLINRKPIAKSSISMPVTYLDLFTDIRKLYEKLPDTQIMGLNAKSFSLFAEGGRCEECKGRGEITLTMKFLADARIKCPICLGKRYKETVCMIKYNGLSISEVLDLTLNQAFEHFKNHKKIVRRLQPAISLGLGYLKMGQTSASLSGGEAQRLKLVPFLSKQWEPGSIIVIDEPTQGLHFEDVERLMGVLQELVNSGITIIIIEHNPDVIMQADWVVDIGPYSSRSGGELLYQGSPVGLLKVKDSPTGTYLSSI